MRKVRKGVFETNSSSTHSICVTKNDILDGKRNFVDFSIGEFGWERDTYHSAYSKAQYLYTGILCNKRFDMIDKLKAILDANRIEYEFEKPEMVESKWGSYLKNGSIDHSGELSEFIDEVCNDEDKLMKYLFSSESFIITGNDNDDYDVDIRVNYPHDEYYKGN